MMDGLAMLVNILALSLCFGAWTESFVAGLFMVNVCIFVVNLVIS